MLSLLVKPTSDMCYVLLQDIGAPVEFVLCKTEVLWCQTTPDDIVGDILR